MYTNPDSECTECSWFGFFLFSFILLFVDWVQWYMVCGTRSPKGPQSTHKNRQSPRSRIALWFRDFCFHFCHAAFRPHTLLLNLICIIVESWTPCGFPSLLSRSMGLGIRSVCLAKENAIAWHLMAKQININVLLNARQLILWPMLQWGRDVSKARSSTRALLSVKIMTWKIFRLRFSCFSCSRFR